MENKDAKALLERYLAGECSPEEKIYVERTYRNLEEYAKEISDDRFREIKAEVWAGLDLKRDEKRPYRLWPRIVAVAAVVAIIVTGAVILNLIQHAKSRNNLSLTHNLHPGKNTATLTFANGETITLSSAKTGVVIDASSLKYNDGTSINNPALSKAISPGGRESINPGVENKVFTVTTPRGGTYQVRLPDGTKVWLNAASSLTYYMPLNERNGVRKVDLYGEAYFEVAKLMVPSTENIATAHGGRPRDDVRIPFIVKTKRMALTVLGTHFNVNAYDDEQSTKATLLEGSIKVSSLSPPPSLQAGTTRQPPDELILKPNQQAVLSGSNQLNVKEVDTELAVAWKKGNFMFESEDIAQVMKKISRWYNVDVIYEGSKPTKEYSGFTSRNTNISEVLNILERTGSVHFKIEGKRIIVSK